MTKRIVSGVFILTALGALGIILAGALTSGEQLIVRFLTAVVVAALGLYVISDLRLQADDDAVAARTRRLTGRAPTAAAERPPPNSTAAFMATVTNRKQDEAEKATTARPASGAGTGDFAETLSATASPRLADAVRNPAAPPVEDLTLTRRMTVDPPPTLASPAPDTVVSASPAPAHPVSSRADGDRAEKVVLNGDHRDDPKAPGRPNSGPRNGVSLISGGRRLASPLTAFNHPAQPGNGSGDRKEDRGRRNDHPTAGGEPDSTSKRPPRPVGTDESFDPAVDAVTTAPIPNLAELAALGPRPLPPADTVAPATTDADRGDDTAGSNPPRAADDRAEQGPEADKRADSSGSEADELAAVGSSPADQPEDEPGRPTGDQDDHPNVDEPRVGDPERSAPNHTPVTADHRWPNPSAATTTSVIDLTSLDLPTDREASVEAVPVAASAAAVSPAESSSASASGTATRTATDIAVGAEIEAVRASTTTVARPADRPSSTVPTLPTGPPAASEPSMPTNPSATPPPRRLPTTAPLRSDAADYADAPLAAIIDLRDAQAVNPRTTGRLTPSATPAPTGDIDNAIKAGELEVISTLIEQGMLSTEGPISDRDVRTMVYVAFTSNELRKLLLAGGSPDRANHGLDLGPVELFDEQQHAPIPKTVYPGQRPAVPADESVPETAHRYLG